MIHNKQIEILTEKAIDSYIHGISSRPDEYQVPARIPSFGDIDIYLTNAIKDIVIGKPFFKAIKQDDISSALKFNKNLLSLIDDFTLLTDEMIAQLYALSRHLQLSEAEFRKVYCRLKDTNKGIDSLLLISKNANGYLYTISDTFENLDKIDTKRSNVLVNTTGGFVQIGESSVYKYKMEHYKNSISPDELKVSKSYTLLDYISTKFSKCISDLENTYYMINVSTEYKDGIGVSFILSPEVNTDSKVTEITISMAPGYLISISYINSKSPNWSMIYNNVVSDNVNKFSIDINDDVRSNGVSSIKFDINKINPDSVNNNNYTYSFIINNISVYSNTINRSSTLISNSLKVDGITYLDYTINQVSLFADEELPSDTGINYYVGVDPYIAGKLLDEFSNPATIDSSTIDSFDPDVSYAGSAGVLASDLRRLNIDGYKNWEPIWTPISPANRRRDITNTTGKYQPKIVDLGNINVTDSEIDGWINSLYMTENGINIFGICEFDAKPYNVSLLQGKDCWIRKIDDFNIEIETEEIGRFVVDEDTNYYLYIGPDYANEDGYIVSRGDVVTGSVVSITWFNADSNDVSNSLVLKDSYPDTIADVNIKYVDGTAIIQKNQTATWSYPEFIVKVKYKTSSQSKSKYIYQSTYYVPNDGNNISPVDAHITITNTNNIDYVINENSTSNFIFNGQDIHGNNSINIPLVGGYNRVKIFASNDFSPSGIIESLDIDHYAYSEPLVTVGELELTYRTHRDDHSKCAITPSGEYYVLLVNDPTTPNNDITYYHDTNGILTSGNIFDTDEHVNDFYDLSYHIISDEVTNIFLKAEMISDVNVSPILRSYDIRCGDSIIL